LFAAAAAAATAAPEPELMPIEANDGGGGASEGGAFVVEVFEVAVVEPRLGGAVELVTLVELEGGVAPVKLGGAEGGLGLVAGGDGDDATLGAEFKPGALGVLVLAGACLLDLP